MNVPILALFTAVFPFVASPQSTETTDRMLPEVLVLCEAWEVLDPSLSTEVEELTDSKGSSESVREKLKNSGESATRLLRVSASTATSKEMWSKDKYRRIEDSEGPGYIKAESEFNLLCISATVKQISAQIRVKIEGQIPSHDDNKNVRDYRSIEYHASVACPPGTLRMYQVASELPKTVVIFLRLSEPPA